MSGERADATLDQLLEFVKETRGFDFTGYKRSTIQRRVAKRMGPSASSAMTTTSTTSNSMARSSRSCSTRC
jgi:chemotaxis methyl-accepting protein methylase